MKTTGLMAAVAAGLFALLGATADAAEPAPGQGARIRERLRGRVRERLVEKFDKDGDGKVGPEERVPRRARRTPRAPPAAAPGQAGRGSRQSPLSAACQPPSARNSAAGQAPACPAAVGILCHAEPGTRLAAPGRHRGGAS